MSTKNNGCQSFGCQATKKMVVNILSVELDLLNGDFAES